jgi:ABC-type branched-subunit amino acid transport system ATPase component
MESFEITDKLKDMSKKEIVNHFSKRHNKLLDKKIELQKEYTTMQKVLEEALMLLDDIELKYSVPEIAQFLSRFDVQEYAGN